MVERRILMELDADGERRGFTFDGTSVVVEMPDGSDRAFTPGASIDGLPARIAPLFGGSTETGGPRIVVQLSAWDLYALRDRVPAQAIRGTVYRWPEGEVLREDHEVYRGVLRDPAWTVAFDERGNPAGTLEATLSAPTRTSDVPFPPTSIGDAARFPLAAERARGQAAPVVYGEVRGLPLYACVVAAGANGVRLILAGHRIVSTTIDVMRDGALVSAETVQYGIDGRGSVYAFVAIDDTDYAAGDSLYAETVTGWAAPDGSAVDRLGDVLLHVWHTYAGERFYELDRRRAYGARPLLNRYRVGFHCNEREAGGSVLRLLAGRLAPQFPVVFGFAGGRFGWDAIVLIEDDAGPVHELTYGLDAFERVGPTETSVEEVLTEFEVTYAADGFAGGTTASERAHAGNNGDCRGAVSRYGQTEPQRIDAPDVPDAATAYLLATDAARRHTKVRDRVEYHGVDPEWYDLPAWCEVLVTDGEAGWEREPFYIEASAPRMDGRADVVLVRKRGV